MIPKTIHYCWFGGNPKPKLVEKCIKSWKKHCPDYEIIEWNESNFDVNCCDYVKEAYEAKKWAFVTDYVRIWALNTYGGIYLDTDVEIKKNMDKFLCHTAFTGFERKDMPFTAVYGSEPNHPLCKTILSYYEGRHFLLPDGSFDTTTNTVSFTTLLTQQYNIILNNETQSFPDGLVVYSNDYFCPKSFVDDRVYKTKNTHAIHWFNASWHTKEQADLRKRTIKYHKKQKFYNRVIHPPIMLAKKFLGDEFYQKIRSKILRR